MSTLPAFADVDDLIEWLGEPITEPGDVSRAQGALRMASALVRNATKKRWVDETSTLLTDLSDDLALVTLASAGRAYNNPEGNTLEGVDDGQVQRKVDEAGVYLTASEQTLCEALRAAAHRGLATVSTTRGETAPRSLRAVTHDECEDPILPPYYV